MASLTQGKAGAAIRLEQLWDEIAKTCNVDILCVYGLNSFQCEQGTTSMRESALDTQPFPCGEEDKRPEA